MRLLFAPVNQLAQARDAIAAFKALGIEYVRIYTSYNSKLGKVRVKFYCAERCRNERTTRKVAALGFEEVRNYRKLRSYLGHF